ncbi:NAD(P)H azoreductase [Streptomyces scabiei]|uniref:NAD(P)H azoreductase n=2 Tax=Streptomyces scabiei TaxID=1930 RepID=A0A100JNJ3_STRSC|nr:NAD(P)H azoreductase [Streptomyces scabiei]
MAGDMNDTPVLVLGGTGKTGRRVARQLAERGRTARVASRSGAHPFDWRDKETWTAAVEDVEAVYVVDEQGPHAAELLADFASFATRRGVDRLVFLSARTLEQWAHDEGRFAAERAVRDSGARWTILRPTWFSQNFSEDRLLAPDVASGEVILPDGEGVEPFVDAEDIAAVAVAALTEEGHAGELYVLSGPRLMTFVECVGLIAGAAGRKIRPVVVDREEYARHLVGRGYARDFADFMNEIFDTIRDGRTAYLSDGVRRALGREPRDFRAYAEETDWDAVSPR